MKHIILFLITLILTLNMPFVIFAEQESEIQTSAELSELYPVSVYESSENGIKKIIKTYELSEDEKPEDIPQNDFQQGNFNYTLADVIKKENSSADVKEHTKTVSLTTDTNDINSIVKQLAQTIEYKSDDGYIGILNLDVNSIKVKTGGTKTDNYTISSVREYPGLSNNDTSLIPKTITDNGKTMTLTGIEWRTQTSSSVDYQELPSICTAIASYTATGTKTIVTGHSVTAEYKGSISKPIQGKTTYTAIFNGKKILPVSNNTAVSSEDVKGGDSESKLSETFIIFIVVFSVIGGIIGFAVLHLTKKHKNNYSELIDDEYSQIPEDYDD